MMEVFLIFRLLLGGLLLGCFLGTLLGSVCGALYGGIANNVSFILDGALLGAGFCGLGGVLYGAFLGATGWIRGHEQRNASIDGVPHSGDHPPALSSATRLRERSPSDVRRPASPVVTKGVGHDLGDNPRSQRIRDDRTDC